MPDVAGPTCAHKWPPERQSPKNPGSLRDEPLTRSASPLLRVSALSSSSCSVFAPPAYIRNKYEYFKKK